MSALDAYIECALWSSTVGEDARPMDDDYGPDDLAINTRAEMGDDVRSFFARNAGYIRTVTEMPGYDCESVAHDFWLTRNRHGAGFWDRGGDDAQLAAFRALTEDAHAYGSSDLYIGDDGKVYAS